MSNDIKLCFAGWYRIGDTAYNFYDEPETVHDAKGWLYVYNMGVKLAFSELPEVLDLQFENIFNRKNYLMCENCRKNNTCHEAFALKPGEWCKNYYPQPAHDTAGEAYKLHV